MLMGMFFVLISSLLLVVTICAARSALSACPDPPDIRFASVSDLSDDNFPVGSTVTYGCELGYVFSGESRHIKCIKSGNDAEWTEPQFSCRPQPCGDPGLITNGQRVGSLFTFPNSVTYYCDEGYVLNGIATRFCQTSGVWSGRLPECKIINCGPPKIPENGYVVVSSFEYGSELSYTCEKGFTLNTPEIIYCTESGAWSKSDVTCIEITCLIPEKPDHGTVRILGNENHLRVGSLVIFTCNGERIPYGPTTSKCLENGIWNFPPPKCLEPCTIPYISDGVIGKYVSKRYPRRKVFQEIPETQRIDNDEDLVLRCSGGFEVSGTEYQEMKISCSKGKWSLEPFCEPISCRSELPPATNAEAVIINSKHGGAVSYECFTDYVKVTDETVICDHGVWKGEPPTCKSTKCSLNDLQYPGILRVSKSVYKDGETFDIVCSGGYEFAVGHDNEVKCEKGSWITSFPPCVAANCTDFPHAIAHGSVKVRSKVHGSIAKFSCEPPYVLVETTLVQCAYGQWNGELPRCLDGRCYLKDLLNLAHVSTETQSITFSGNRLNVICEDGYSARGELPVCRNGVWSKNYESPCAESSCLIPRLYHGSVAERHFGKWYWHFWNVRFERTLTYVTIPAASSVPSGSVLWLRCENPYSVLGRGKEDEEIKCSKGTWSMDLVCLRRGELYIPTTAAPKLKRFPSSHLETSLTVSTSRTELASLPVTQSSNTAEWLSSTEANTDQSYATKHPEDECFCEYPIDDDSLVATVKLKQLKYGDRVRNSSKVVFRCLHVGYHHFRGHQEITCDNCKPWHSSDFPSCSKPKEGDAVIIFDKNVDILANGTLEIYKGKRANFTCIAYIDSKYPIWNVSTNDEFLRTSKERVERDDYMDVLYLTHLLIPKVDYKNEGKYECYLEGNRKTTIDVIVTDPDLRCPEFPEDDKITIEYELERRERSKAAFSCPQKGQELVGVPELTCLRNSEWSDPPPYCSGLRCKKIKETNMLVIDYLENREIGTFVAFHCKDPGKRLGVGFTKCLENATWADPTPTCEIPFCSESDLLSEVPQHVLPQISTTDNHSIPYNYTVKLMCKNGMIALGSPMAKCGKDGKWDIDTVQCDSGCQPFERDADSKLKYDPDKEIYKFGERLTFSCPPGLSLNSESQAIMCLIDGWSETDPPTCEENENYEDFPDYTQNSNHTSSNLEE